MIGVFLLRTLCQTGRFATSPPQKNIFGHYGVVLWSLHVFRPILLWPTIQKIEESKKRRGAGTSVVSTLSHVRIVALKPLSLFVGCYVLILIGEVVGRVVEHQCGNFCDGRTHRPTNIAFTRHG